MTTEELKQQVEKILQWPAQLRSRKEVEILHEARALCHKGMNELVQTEISLGRNLNEEERTQYEALEVEYRNLSDEIRRSPYYETPETARR